MSALPTSEERMVNPGIPGSSTLPHGADGYTLVQVRGVCVCLVCKVTYSLPICSENRKGFDSG